MASRETEFFENSEACCQVALGAMNRYPIGGGQITPRRSYLDQGGTTPLLRAYAIDCPRCSC